MTDRSFTRFGETYRRIHSIAAYVAARNRLDQWIFQRRELLAADQRMVTQPMHGAKVEAYSQAINNLEVLLTEYEGRVLGRARDAFNAEWDRIGEELAESVASVYQRRAGRSTTVANDDLHGELGDE